MTVSIRTRLTAATTAFALALGSLGLTATPAAARNNDKALAWILGLGAAAVIINEIDKDNRRNPTPVMRPAPPRPEPRYDDHRDHRDYRDDRRVVPSSCLIDVRTRDGRREVVSGRCAEQSVSTRNLPRSCAFDLITDHGRRETVYGRNCLEDNGVRISRR